jgi:hypothetical protein
MKAKVIKADSDYAAALARIEKVMDAKRNTAQGAQSVKGKVGLGAAGQEVR